MARSDPDTESGQPRWPRRGGGGERGDEIAAPTRTMGLARSPEEEKVSLVVEGRDLPVLAHGLGVKEGLEASLDAPAEPRPKVVQNQLGVVVLEGAAVAEDLPAQAERRELEGERGAARQVNERQAVHLERNGGAKRARRGEGARASVDRIEGERASRCAIRDGVRAPERGSPA